MTKKHFEAIAAIIKARNVTYDEPAAEGFDLGYETGVLTVLEDVANDLANYFIGENDRFNEAKFLAACGF